MLVEKKDEFKRWFDDKWSLCKENSDKINILKKQNLLISLELLICYGFGYEFIIE